MLAGEQPPHLLVPPRRRPRGGAHTLAIGAIDVGARLEQQLHDGAVPVAGRGVEGGPARSVRHIRVGAARKEKRARELLVPSCTRLHQQCKQGVAPAGIDRRARLRSVEPARGARNVALRRRLHGGFKGAHQLRSRAHVTVGGGSREHGRRVSLLPPSLEFGAAPCLLRCAAPRRD